MENILISMLKDADDTLKAYTTQLFSENKIDIIDIQYMRDAVAIAKDNKLSYNTTLAILTYQLLIQRKNGGSALDIDTNDTATLNALFENCGIAFLNAENFYTNIQDGNALQFLDLKVNKLTYNFNSINSRQTFIEALKKETKPLIYFKTGTGKDKLCFRADFFSEFNTLKSCTELKDNTSSFDGFEGTDDESIKAFVKEIKGDKINDEQLAAIIGGCKNHISIITGGPGTGKTTTITMLLRTLLHYGNAEELAKQIVLAAPTGRAAQRISEAVRNEIGNDEFEEHAELLKAIPAKTIHDLLRQSFSAETTFRHNATNILHYTTIIIDEASMIDNKLFESFLAAVDKNSRIVIVGDPQQLPSVNAGNMLQTLIKHFDGGAQITKLTKTYRASGGVGDIFDMAKTKQLLEEQKATAPAEGKIDYIWDDKKKPYCFFESSSYRAADYVKAVWHWINKLIKETELENLISQHYNPNEKNEGETHTKLVKILKLIEKAQALSVLRNGLEGCNYINEKIFEGFCRQEKKRYPSYYPIIITQNNSALGLTNGQMGIVLCGENKRYHAYFLDGEQVRSIPYENLPGFENAYVITVHKSQGSQYKNVLLVLPSKGDSPLLTKSIVYTAVTRAKRTVTVIGGQAALDTYDINEGKRTTVWS